MKAIRITVEIGELKQGGPLGQQFTVDAGARRYVEVNAVDETDGAVRGLCIGALNSALNAIDKEIR